MTIKIEAETFEETWDRFKDATRSLFLRKMLMIPAQGKQRGKFGYWTHTAINIWVEFCRRNAQFAAKTILFGFPAMILMYEWGNVIIPQ